MKGVCSEHPQIRIGRRGLQTITPGSQMYIERNRTYYTYIMLPDNFVCGRICMHFAFEVDIIAFLDVFRIQIRAQRQQQRRHNCNRGGMPSVRVKTERTCANDDDGGGGGDGAQVWRHPLRNSTSEIVLSEILVLVCACACWWLSV